MNILFAASEMTPIAKVGGLGDVIGALPQALARQGINARVIIPRYERIKKDELTIVARDFPVSFGEVRERVSVYMTQRAGVTVYLLDNERYLSRGDIYFEKSAFVGTFAEIERFLFFSQAVVQTLGLLPAKPDILHCHDWHASMIIPLTRLIHTKTPKTMLTIHNIANQGKWNAEAILKFLGLRGDEWNSLRRRSDDRSLNIFEQGILNADAVTTVSPTYAKEILDPEFGFGLEYVIEERKAVLRGIVNGIDVDRFNPETDTALTARYSVSNVKTRTINKSALCARTTLRLTPSSPLFGFIGRLAIPDQKGVDLLLSVLPEFRRMNAGLVFLGAGDDVHERAVLKAQSAFPQNFFPVIGFDAELAQLMYGGCDFMLVPSRFEPCGLVQMIAMRYGSIPVVRKVGGLADTVHDIGEKPYDGTQGNGIVFQDFIAAALLHALQRACELFRETHSFARIQKRAMSQDHSWQRSAKDYRLLYREL